MLAAGIVFAAAAGCSARGPAAAHEASAPAARKSLPTDPAALRTHLRAQLEAPGNEASPTTWRGYPETVVPFTEFASTSSEAPELRVRALHALASVESPEAFAALHDIIRNDKLDVVFRSEAVMAVASGSGKASLDALLPLLTGPDAALRQSTARALGVVGGPVAQSSLEAQLETETTPDVRDAIQQSLTKIQP